jgi:hypothetical protein
MTEPAKKTILTTPAGVAYYGAPVIDFLNRNDALKVPTIVATPSDCANSRWNPSRLEASQLEEVMKNAGVSSVRMTTTNACAGVREQRSHATKVMGTEGTVNVIVASERQESGADIFKRMAGLPAGSQVAVPGDVKDWRAFILFHEKGHHDNGHVGDTAAYYGGLAETEADRTAKQLYEKARAEGVVQEPRLPELIQASRILSSFMSPGVSAHDISGMQGKLPGQDLSKPGGESASARISVGLNLPKAQGEVCLEAIRLQDPGQYNIIMATAIAESITKTDALPKEAKDYAEQMKEAVAASIAGKPGAAAHLAEMLKPMAGLSNQDDVLAIAREQATEAFKTDAKGEKKYAPFVLAAAVNARDTGRLDGIEGGKDMANAFIATAQKYAPNAFVPPSPQAAPLAPATPTTAPTEPAQATTASAEPPAVAADAPAAVKPAALKTRGGGFGM